MPKVIINEFYRGTTLTTGDEFVEVLLVEDLTATQLNSFFVGDSTGTKTSKFSAYDFTNTDSIAPVFKAGTIIAIGGATAFAQNTSYNPAGGDWNIFLNAGGSFLPNANSGNTGDIAGDDVVWVDTVNTGATISADGFAVDIGTATGAFTSAVNVNFGASTNNTGYALNSDLAGATSTANWTTGIAAAATTSGQPNGGANTTYINGLRSSTPDPQLTVSIQATDAAAAELGADPGTFRITRTGDTAAALTVNYTIATGAGQATAADYTPNLAGAATIATGQSFVDVTITPVDDTTVEGNETVTLTLTDTADYDLGATTTAIVTIADNDVAAGTIRIHDIQGAAHVSPLVSQSVVNVPGIVTALRSNGFYVEDPNPDSNDATSEGIFVFTSSAPAVSVGASVLVSGTVSEFRPGGDVENLSLSQLNSPSIVTLSSGNPLPAPTVISAASATGVRTIPNRVITNDFGANGDVEGSLFDPAQDAIDFYESLEGMRVQINNPVTTGLRNSFGELWVLADGGTGATGVNSRGSITVSGADAATVDAAFANSDFNPESIQLDDALASNSSLANANSGTQLNTIVGVVNYDFGEYEILPTATPTVVTPSSLTKEVTNVTAGADQLTIATFNVENLDPGDGQARFNALAGAIVTNLKSPDIISLEEIQDNNGATNDSVVDASTTLQTLINAIAAAGGPTYEFRQINPVDDTNGGQPGGNIRVGFLFNPDRVDFVDRAGGTSTTGTTVNTVNGDAQLSASPGLIDPTNTAFNSSRKPLVGEFVFNNQTVFVIGNHFTSRGGSDALYERIQPPTQGGQSQRENQAAVVNQFVDSLLAANSKANVAVVGDFNEFQFFPALQILEGDVSGQQKVLNNLIETLPVNERYTYNFEGNAQAIDHILTSNNLFSKLDGFDVVHINSEFTDQLSDHEPLVARFNLPIPNLAPTAVNFTSTTTSLAENTSTATRIKVADIAVTDDGQGTNVLGLSGTDASFFELEGNGLYLKANTSLNFEAKSSYAVTVAVDDVTVGNTPDASNSFTLNISNVNEAPIANNDSGFTANQSMAESIQASSLLANDTDPDANTTLSILPNGFSNAVGGSVTLNGSNVVFAPNSSFSGTASFKYTVTDGSLTSQATVTLEVGQTVNGGNGKDTLTGNNGNDNLNGGNGEDSLVGNGGNDTLLGDNGSDILFGGNGDDWLNGGNGDDILNGGAGRDTFVLSRNGNGTDTIQDFTIGQDQIGLSGGVSFGQLSFTDVNGSAAIRFGNDTLALLPGVNASQLLQSSFILV